MMVVLTGRCAQSCRLNDVIVVCKVSLKSSGFLFFVFGMDLGGLLLYFFGFFGCVGLLFILDYFRRL
jgi:hypothetical protein